jgi:anti-anti-sigma factor
MQRRDAHRSTSDAGPGGNDTGWSGERLRRLARRRAGLHSSDTPDEDEVLQLRVDRLRPGPTVITVTGQLDLAGVPEVRTQVRELLSREEPVVLDLGGTTFLDVSGVRLLVALSAEAWAAGAWFGVLPRIAPAVARVLDLTGLRPLVSFATPDGRSPRADPEGPAPPP